MELEHNIKKYILIFFLWDCVQVMLRMKMKLS